MYFSILCDDVIRSLLLNYFNSDDLYNLLIELNKIPYFHDKFHNNSYEKFWQSLYTRHISSIKSCMPSFSYHDYMYVMNYIKELKYNHYKIYKLAKLGYDQALYPLLKTKDDYNAALIAASIGQYMPIVEKMISFGATIHKEVNMDHLPHIEKYLTYGGHVFYNQIKQIGCEAAIDLMVKYSSNESLGGYYPSSLYIISPFEITYDPPLNNRILYNQTPGLTTVLNMDLKL